MANAAVDKLKALGMRHGEKVVVALTATIFVVCVAKAIMNPVLEMRPEELKTAATGAQSNLQTKQTESDILAKLEKDGLKEPNFQKIIEGQIANALKPDDYRARLDWVSPEPGAGLIRDQPELIAPVELTAFPGRGGILMYALDDKGERIIDNDPKAKGNDRMGMMGMGAPGSLKGGDDSKKKQTAEEKRRAELEEKKRKGLIAGNADAADEKKDKPAADAPPQGPYKEVTKGQRWVVITAVLDNAKLKKNYLLALKNEAIAYPNYKRVDVERQVLESDGSWSEWTPTEKEKNWAIIDNLPEVDTEFVPANQRPEALVDPLPFLKAGYWTGVHVAKLTPPEVLEKKDQNTSGSSFKGMGEMMRGAGGGGSSSSYNPQGGSGGKMGLMGMGGGRSMPGSSSGAMAEGSADDTSFTKYDEDTVMIRSLDFTVEQDKTYRFRLRIVVVNPNLNHTDVNPGVDVESKNLYGPWSEPSPIVSVPADVVAYAKAPEQAERRDDIVTFQVVRWDPSSGHTVIKNDSRSPGEIIGEYGRAPMPNSEGTGPKSELIDFNSRSVVLDTFGGRQKLPDIGIPRNQFEVPAMAMIVQPDGNVVVRNQALDRADEVRQDMEANYNQAIEDSNKAREKSSKSRSGGGRRGKGKGRSRGMMGGGGSSRQG